MVHVKYRGIHIYVETRIRIFVFFYSNLFREEIIALAAYWFQYLNETPNVQFVPVIGCLSCLKYNQTQYNRYRAQIQQK